MTGNNGSAPTGGVRGEQDLRFGIFMAPAHDVATNQQLQIERNLELVELADKLGFDEAWHGEHLSVGASPFSSPEMFMTAASQRTHHIRLGTAVSSLPYHNPFTLANRILDLDHISHGRAMMGMGPGQSPEEAMMMGIDHALARDRMVEAAEVIIPLLRGEVVSRETDWFTLRDARLQSLPCNPNGIEYAVASAFTPSGSTLAGRLGIGLLSASAGFIHLADHWANLEKHALENGHRPDRASWRIVGAMHLAESRERARAEARTRILAELIDNDKVMTAEDQWQPWMDDADAAIEKWTTDGIPRFGGVAVIGTPDEAVDAIRSIADISGGFGCYVLQLHNAAPYDATRRSLELFAEYVIPEVRRTNQHRKDTARRHHARTAEYAGEMFRAVDDARRKFGLGPLLAPPEGAAAADEERSS